MTDFIGDSECITHHHACDCREAVFRQMKKALEYANLELWNASKVRGNSDQYAYDKLAPLKKALAAAKEIG